MKKRYRIENLDCANCAAKLERAIQQLDGVQSASVQFVQKQLVLEAESADYQRVFAAVKRRTAEIEPDVEYFADIAQEKSAFHLEKKHIAEIVRLAASVILLLVLMLIQPEGWLRPVLFAVPWLLAGYPVLFSALRNLLRGQLFDEAFLMTAATAGAFAIGEYPEAAAVMIFFCIGELFEEIAVGRSRSSIASLMDIRPDRAVVLREGKEESVKPEEVQPGEIILIRPGERIPLDGTVTEGHTTVQTAALTGESAPAAKNPGDEVFSGTVNQSGAISVRVSSSYAESTVSRILEMVENASEKKSRAERFITRFSRWYTPLVVIAAVLLAVIPPLLFSQSWSDGIHRACVFLMVSCPCALVVSVPLSFFGGIGGVSRRGILVKGANDLEALAAADTVIFDKTGTLTHGEFAVEAIHPQECTPDALLDIAAAAEQRSTHPVAESIMQAHGGHLDPSRLSEAEELAGHGVHAVIDGKDYYVGSHKLMEQVGAKWKPCHHTGTIIHISEGNTYLGHIVISDKIKAEAKQTVTDLHALGIHHTVMLTGDLEAVAKDVGGKIGIDEIRAQLLPGEKVAAVEEMLSAGRKTVFVGDGINDAPVLMRADTGIAMGAMGSDAAMEAADIVLMDDRLPKLCTAIAAARKTMRIVRENIWLALAVKFLILIWSAFGNVSLWLAVFGDVGVLILAVLNALRAMKLPKEYDAAPAHHHEHHHDHEHDHHDHDHDHHHDHEHHHDHDHEHHHHDDDDDCDCCCGHDHEHEHHHHDHDHEHHHE